MNSGTGHQITHGVWRGFPIRTSWDHGPVIDSPRLFADSHVLHRLPMPRHPPCALINLATNDQNEQNRCISKIASRQTAGNTLYKMLASTMQFSNNNPVRTPAPRTRRTAGHGEPGQCAGTGQNTTRTAGNKPPRRGPCCLRTQQCAMDPPRAGALRSHRKHRRTGKTPAPNTGR